MTFTFHFHWTNIYQGSILCQVTSFLAPVSYYSPYFFPSVSPARGKVGWQPPTSLQSQSAPALVRCTTIIPRSSVEGPLTQLSGATSLGWVDLFPKCQLGPDNVPGPEVGRGMCNIADPFLPGQQQALTCLVSRGSPPSHSSCRSQVSSADRRAPSPSQAGCPGPWAPGAFGYPWVGALLWWLRGSGS